MVTLGQLWARKELALDILVDPPGARAKEITIIHSSELPEVDEWLAGGEVLLTIGVTQDLGSKHVEDYVDRLVGAGVRGLGVGLGSDLPFQAIPDRLRRYAQEVGLPLFGVPEPVPFVALVDAFTRLREVEANRELTNATRAQRRFATALAHGGPTGLLAELAGVLGAQVHFVSPTGRGLTGSDAPNQVRHQLIEEANRQTTVPRLIRNRSADMIQAVPVGDDHVRGWILCPAEAPGSSRFRSLLVSTAAALLGLDVPRRTPRREESPLFTTALSADEARHEWLALTGSALTARPVFTVFGQVRGDSAAELMADLSTGIVLTRSGAMMGVLHTGQPLVEQVAKVAKLETLFSRSVPLTRVHHTWTVWKSQHESMSSDLSILLSSVDEAAATEFVDRVLGRFLAGKDGRILLDTLRAFIAAGGVRDQVAHDLGIHRHTVRARLAKIEKLLGRDLSQAGTVQTVAIALELAEL